MGLADAEHEGRVYTRVGEDGRGDVGEDIDGRVSRLDLVAQRPLESVHARWRSTGSASQLRSSR